MLWTVVLGDLGQTVSPRILFYLLYNVGNDTDLLCKVWELSGNKRKREVILIFLKQKKRCKLTFLFWRGEAGKPGTHFMCEELVFAILFTNLSY